MNTFDNHLENLCNLNDLVSGDPRHSTPDDPVHLDLSPYELRINHDKQLPYSISLSLDCDCHPIQTNSCLHLCHLHHFYARCPS